MATYYIATTGDDVTGDGSEANPWATTGKAYTESTTGDTINIAAGTYTGNLQGNREWVGAGMLTTTINGIIEKTGSYTSFYHQYNMTIELDANNSNRMESYSYNGYGFIFDNVRVFGNGFGATGVNGQYGYGRLLLTRSIFYDISVGSTDLFMPYGATSTEPNFLINNCIFSKLTGGSRFLYPLSTGSGNVLKNTVFDRNGGDGTKALYLIGKDLTKFSHTYNAYYGVSISGDTLDSTEITLSSDPFLDSANKDFRPAVSSDIINAGQP